MHPNAFEYRPPTFDDIRKYGKKGCVNNLKIESFFEDNISCGAKISDGFGYIRIWLKDTSSDKACYLTSDYKVICDKKFCKFSESLVKEIVESIEIQAENI